MEIDVRGETHWEALRGQVEAHGGVSVTWPPAPRPAQFAEVELVFRAADAELARAKGQVVHLSEDGHVSLVVAGTQRVALLEARYPQAPQAPEAPEAPQAAEEADKPLWTRWEGLAKTEKIKAARQGGADLRRLVLKDPDQSLHAYLLTNPGLTASEVAGLIRAGAAPATFISRVAQRADLAGNAAVAEAIVASPTSPVPLAVQLVARLPIDAVRRMAKAGKLRAPVLAAARKRVV